MIKKILFLGEIIDMNEVQNVINKIIKFRDDRDWKQFHNPKDLAISLSIEASELLECFQWKNTDEVNNLINSNLKEKIEEEIADIGNYLLLLCNELGVDFLDAIDKKIDKNSEKYPIEKCKGKSNKYNEY